MGTKFCHINLHSSKYCCSNLARSFNLREFDDCIRAFTNWFEYILNSLDTPYTNGFVEGKNNRIKVLKRNAYGVQNFERFRKRILLSC
ncbi:MAG TPA: hypothetical protein DHU79_01880 [Clostridiales bacterium]|nr:hypothetical protein [Clostridiales bacterium]